MTFTLDQMSIVPLSKAAQFANDAAQWHYDEWGHMYEPSMKAEFFSDMQRCADNGGSNIPQAWLALYQGKMIATVCVLESDLDSYKHLTPWLMNVLVSPDYRGHGIASMMVTDVLQWAKQQSIKTLYMYTEDQQSLYQRLGFATFDETGINGHPITLMKQQLTEA